VVHKLGSVSSGVAGLFEVATIFEEILIYWKGE